MARVLIVEDEGLLRELAVDEFSDAGYTVEQAANAEEALVMLKNGTMFDVLFTDVRMPGTVDGWELGRLAGDILPEIRVIYATGYSETTRPLTDSEHFLQKPYRCEHVLGLIRQWGIHP
ncbi:response regulator [Novosphingobium sp.]|jgi:CheY-like chemotaxis protein|uniref:response regulator n=1 Tax=Novosphingobium sp. TaxID=1874826 RepID=UPI0035651E56